MTVHPRPCLHEWPDNRPIVPRDLTLLHAGMCLPVADAAILCESALNQRRISLHDVLAIVGRLPKNRRRPLVQISVLSQSGTETRVRWFLESRQVHVKAQQIHVKAQQMIDGVGRVDLLVGKGFVIECDSVTYHSSPEQFHEDRRRDGELLRLGYLSRRLTWEDVFIRWEETKKQLGATIASRRHRYLRPS